MGGSARLARMAGLEGWEREWRAQLEKLVTPSREGIRNASKFAIAQVASAETVVQVRPPGRFCSRAVARGPAPSALCPLCARPERAATTQMIVDRMTELSPRERVPMLFLVDAIVQVIAAGAWPSCCPLRAWPHDVVAAQNSRLQGIVVYSYCVGQHIGARLLPSLPRPLSVAPGLSHCATLVTERIVSLALPDKKYEHNQVSLYKVRTPRTRASGAPSRTR